MPILDEGASLVHETDSIQMKQHIAATFANEPIRNTMLGCSDHSFYERNERRISSFSGTNSFLENTLRKQNKAL